MIITALTPQKRRQGRTSVYVDGEFVFGMDNADLVKYKLAEGMEISKEQLNKLLKQVVVIKARDTALRYLSTKPRSRCEVARRLEEDGYPQAVVNHVLLLMVKYRYINDAQYARDFMESRTKQGYGPYRVKQELKQKGINEEYIDRAALFTAGDDKKYIREWFVKKRIEEPAALDPRERKRCVNALMRRGFNYGVIKQVMDNAADDDEND
jgi:regulatory protein